VKLTRIVSHGGQIQRALSKRMKLGVAAIALLPTIGAGYVGLSTQSASAAVLYGVNMVQACEEHGHLGASFWNTTPYGWYCYDFSPAPPFWSWAGGVDIQGWCNRHYPGTHSFIYQNNLYGWRCST
jgi:hypothetical protein